MSIFKKAKKEEKQKGKKSESGKAEAKKEKVLAAKKTAEKGKGKEIIAKETGEKNNKLKLAFDANSVLLAPHIAEKPTILAEKNQYVFKVYPRSNKVEIKKAVEKVYNVNVESVKIIKVPRKRRRVGRTTGWRKGYKKAIVKVKKGQQIELLPR